MKTKVDMRVIETIMRDELDGTGLECVVVVYRPGFMERGDEVAVAGRSKDAQEMADALMKATDQMTERMKAERE